MKNKAIKHFSLVLTHKWYVFKNCACAGIPWRGIKHDLSKFSPIEFIESARYFTGIKSPIDACKEVNGVSLAWQHHKGRNTHHWEYWIDNFGNGSKRPTPQLIPFEDCVEMLCDYIGAGQSYEKDNWSPRSQLKWWNWKKNNVLMHPVVWNFIDFNLNFLYNKGRKRTLNKKRLKLVYDNLVLKQKGE